MNAQLAVRPFPVLLVFPDVDPLVLAREEGSSLDGRGMLDGTWAEYLRRVLPPVAEPGRLRLVSTRACC